MKRSWKNVEAECEVINQRFYRIEKRLLAAFLIFGEILIHDRKISSYNIGF